MPIENFIHKKRTFPLEIPVFIELCCPPPPLELMKEISGDENYFDTWSQCTPKVPPPEIEFLSNFRNDNETFDNIQNKSDDLTEIKLNPINGYQLSRLKVVFSLLSEVFFNKQNELENTEHHIALSDPDSNKKEENKEDCHSFSSNLNRQSKKEQINENDSLLSFSSDDKSKNDATKTTNHKSFFALPNFLSKKKQKNQDIEKEMNRDKSRCNKNDINESKANHENRTSKIISIFFIDILHYKVCKIDVRPTDKVIDVKTELKKITGTFIKQQHLFYDDCEMENDKKICDYSIPNKATLILFSQKDEFYRQVSIKPPIGKPIDIEITRSTTIKDIKDEIFKLRGIPQSKQQIFSYNKKLLDDSSIALNTIYSPFTAHLKYDREKTRKILIKPSDSDYVQLLVDENDTIDDIKYEVGKTVYQLESNNSELMFSGIKLDNDRRIKDYLLPLDAILDFHIYRKSGIIVYIKNGCGEFIPIEVTPKEKIISVKEQIHEIKGILPCQQKLFFEGKTLRDENEIQFYRIDPFSVIELVFLKDSKASKQIKISIKLPSIDKPFQINVDPMVQVKDLKSLIELMIGPKLNEQKLVFQSKQLEDNFTLHHYSITDNSMILLAPFERQQIKIAVNLPSGKTLAFDMNLTDFTKELKMKIYKQTGFPIDKQVLIRKFEFLKDDDSFQAQKVTSDSTVNLYLIERGGFYIQIKISFFDYLPIEVKSDDTILYIKNEIFKRKGIPINERTLLMASDDTKVSELGLKEYCTLSYVPYKQGAFQLFLRNLNGKAITLYFRDDELISEVQKVIELMEGVEIRDQRIIFAGKQLDYRLTLRDYGIHKDSTLQLAFRLRG